MTIRGMRRFPEVFLFFLVLSLVAVEASARDSRHILMLHSYHWGMGWTDGQVRGFVDRIKEEGIRTTIIHEQLDVIGQPKNFDYDYFARHLKWRLGARKFELIVTTDQAALRFVMAKYDELFKGIPVVFSDVGDLSEFTFPDDMPVTGVREHRDFQPTVDIARKLRPKTKRIVVFGNRKDNGSGPAQAQKFFQTWTGDIPVEFHLDKRFEEIVEIAAGLSPDDIVFGLAYALDRQGSVRGYNEVLAAVNKVTPAPMFVFWTTSLAGGAALGGKVNAPERQGRLAAEMGLRVLAGKDPREIPIAEAPAWYAFDFHELERFNIDLGDLPLETEIKRWPYSVYENFKTEIWTAGAVMFLLIVIILVLLHAIHRRQVAEQALQDSEDRFRDFASLGADWFWETDAEHRLTFVSEGIRRMIGKQPEDMVGKTRMELYGGDKQFVSDDFERHREQLERRETFSDYETTWLGDPDQSHHFSLTGRPVFGKNGAFLGYRGVGRDITAIRQATLDLKLALYEAKLANDAKSQFLAAMSHEFRTPLNAILGFAEVMHGERLGSMNSTVYVNYAGHIVESGKHLLALINDILDISAIEAGGVELEFSKVDLRGVLDEAIDVYGDSPDGRVAVDRDIPDDLPLVRGNERALLQIFINLLSNALKFSSDQGRVLVKVQVVDGNVIVQVSDTGIGIAKERLGDIVKPFSQASQDPHKAQEGSGLGLSIAKSLIDHHGGDLRIDSELGKGTTVSVTLPIAEVVTAELTAAAPAG